MCGKRQVTLVYQPLVASEDGQSARSHTNQKESLLAMVAKAQISFQLMALLSYSDGKATGLKSLGIQRLNMLNYEDPKL